MGRRKKLAEEKPFEPTAAMLAMPAIARAGGAVYLRLPRELRRPAGECSCDYCKAHPEEMPMWDTLVVGEKAPTRLVHDATWTVHLPDPERFLAAMGRLDQERNRIAQSAKPALVASNGAQTT